MHGSSRPSPTLLYKALSWIILPAAFVYTTAVAAKQRNLQYFLQRLGFYNSTSKATQPIWCHCASVGEIKTALPLLKNLIKHEVHLVVSTNTTTGLDILLQANLTNTTAVFLPLDYSIFAEKFINAFSPSFCLVLETELWPNILLTAIKQSIPIVIINGRISKKTLNAPAFIKKNYSLILGNIEHIFASSESNSIRYIKLGADKNRVSTLDNLKFSNIEKDALSNPLKQRFILCASTHADEESQILNEWKKRSWNNIQLVIAIRHPQRKNEVCKILENLNMDYVLHSENPYPKSKNDIYIIDTVGELAPFMQHAELIFMGGSLVSGIGGHNILEAAKYGKCILNGPYYKNFTEIIDEMKQQDSIVVVSNIEDLMNQANQLIGDANRMAELGTNAKNFLTKKSKVVDEYTDKIVKLVRSYSS